MTQHWVTQHWVTQHWEIGIAGDRWTSLGRVRQTAVVHSYLQTPVATLLAERDEVGLSALWFEGQPPAGRAPLGRRDDHAFADLRGQLAEYFAGERTDFELPLHPKGTDFQLRAWAALRQIPYGRTISYGQQASAIGQPTAVRAVGLANGQNPLPIVVPCHRVIGSSGRLTGYAGGLEAKRWLLDLESQPRLV